MIEHFPPDLVPGQEPLWGQKPKPSRHPVKAHERNLPPRPGPDPEDEPTFGPEFPPLEPQPRVIPVSSSIRRNPRHQETSMTSILPPEDDIHPRATAIAVKDLASTAHARRDDPQTSHEAAGATNLRRAQVYVLRAFQRDEETKRSWNAALDIWGMTDEELVTSVHARLRTLGFFVKFPSPSGLRTARKELQRAGLVEPTGRQAKTSLGNSADVYGLTEPGRAFNLPEE